MVHQPDSPSIGVNFTLAALKRYFPASLVAPLPNSEQINHPSSNQTYTKSTSKHIYHHYTPSVTLTKSTSKHIYHHYTPSVTLTHTTHTSSLQRHPHTHHIVTLDLWKYPAGVTALLARWKEKLAGGPQAGRSDSPTSKGHGSG